MEFTYKNHVVAIHMDTHSVTIGDANDSEDRRTLPFSHFEAKPGHSELSVRIHVEYWIDQNPDPETRPARVVIPDTIVTITGGVGERWRGEVAIVDMDGTPEAFAGDEAAIYYEWERASNDYRWGTVALATNQPLHHVCTFANGMEMYFLLEATSLDVPEYTDMDDVLDFLTRPDVLDTLRRLFQ